METVLSPKKVAFGSFSLSLLVHLSLLLLIGTVAIGPGMIPKVPSPIPEGSFEPKPIDILVPPLLPPDNPDAPVSPSSPADSPSSDPFQSGPAIAPAILPGFIHSPGFPGLPVGPEFAGSPLPPGGGESAGPGHPKIPLPPLPPEARLGVLLDVSGSAHPHLGVAIREIERNFPQAVTVLALGCGMRSDVDRGTVKVERFGALKPDRDRDRAGARTTLGQLAMAENANRDLVRVLRDLRGREDVFAIYGGDIWATQFGFEQLIASDVEAIYWFADFQDAVDPKIMDRLARELERKGIKLYAHNFAGKPVRNEVEAAARKTGGASLVLQPER